MSTPAAAEPPPAPRPAPTRLAGRAPRRGLPLLWQRIKNRVLGRKQDGTTYTMLPVLMEVFAGFSKIDGEVMEEEIDSSLGFMRYDYPEEIYSELRRVYLDALQRPPDLGARARELGRTLTMEQKILLGVQLYLLISRSANSRQQLVEFYLFMTNLGIASQAIDIVYQLNAEERPADETDFRTHGGQPLETLRIASREPYDVLLRSLSEGCHVVAFRYQNLVLLKNTGTVPVLVRSRMLRPGDFSRLYPGERIVLEEASLDYADFISYFNAKKNLTGTQLYLTFTEEGAAEISQARGRASNLRISFGLAVTIEALRDTDAKINNRRLRSGVKLEASIEDKIISRGEVEISLQELRRRAREFGEQFRLEGSRNTYMVSNNPDLLEEGDILLSREEEGEVLLKITCDYEEKTGELEVLRTDRSVSVGGVMVKDRIVLKDGDTITLGDGQYLRCHFADRIIEEERNVIRSVELREVGHRFDPRETALDGISLTARRGEMICVMGPSGCGKSTLLRALAGQMHPASGEILFNGFSLYAHDENLKPYLAWIPQEDTYDPLLRVQENLDYSIAVRSPHLPYEERRKRADAKLVELGLNSIRRRLAGTPQQKFLSGGERKRLNAGLDMIGLADVYLFDEPTSGLSSKDSEHVLELIHSLARNKIVFVSIHQPSLRLLRMFDKALLLDKGGKMAFYGTPQGMLEYFWTAFGEETGQGGEPQPMPDKLTPDFIFDVLETPLRDISGDIIHEQTPDGHLLPARRFPPNFWRDRYQTHVLLRSVTPNAASSDSVRKEESRQDTLAQAQQRRPPAPPKLTSREELILFATAFKRAFLSKLRNRANLLTTVLEAPLLALLIALVLRYSEDDNYTFASAFHVPTYIFLSHVVAMFLGLTNSADEVIRDRPMLHRERNHNLRVFYYIFGKIATLATFALLQCTIYLFIGNWVLELREMFTIHLWWMFLTSLTGVCLGMLVSALVHDTRTALNIIPLLLIPQIILGGALIKYEEMNKNLDFVYSIRRWISPKEGETDNSNASKLKVPLICEVMPLRWSYESAIISQAKLNPLTRSQELLENRIQTLINLPKGEEMTEKQRKELDFTKQALAVVSGLQDEDADKLATRLKRIQAGISAGRLEPDLLDQAHWKKSVSAEDIYVNRKVLDLVTKAEMEREDYRRKTTPNVFFGTVKTYHPFSLFLRPLKPSSENDTLNRLPRDVASAQVLPWYRELSINTLVLNNLVMLATLVLIIAVLNYTLRRQLVKA